MANSPDELKARTVEEMLIETGAPELAQVTTSICENPAIQQVIKGIRENGGSDNLVEMFKTGVVMGFHVGANHVRKGYL